MKSMRGIGHSDPHSDPLSDMGLIAGSGVGLTANWELTELPTPPTPNALARTTSASNVFMRPSDFPRSVKCVGSW